MSLKLDQLTWESITEILNRCGLFLLSNLLILLLVSRSFETLPGQSAPEEVHEDVTECFEIISSRLFAAQMCVDGHVSSSAG